MVRVLQRARSQEAIIQFLRRARLTVCSLDRGLLRGRFKGALKEYLLVFGEPKGAFLSRKNPLKVRRI